MGDVVRSGAWSGRRASGDGSGIPPGGEELEKRVEKLETAMADVQVRLIRVESKLDLVATKADLAQLQGDMFKAMNEQTWKFIGAATGMSALFAAIAFGLARALS
ncbi:hypothetical protein QM298_14170 [Pseudomonas mendocina]|nr:MULTISPECIES: hypothetical protein [Pseudomonas]MDV5862025.1 hypothetical protein [Pseudomonas mendocina]MDZ4192881.1 hypothetical protein [Pseudomonas sp.]